MAVPCYREENETQGQQLPQQQIDKKWQREDSNTDHLIAGAVLNPKSNTIFQWKSHASEKLNFLFPVLKW